MFEQERYPWLHAPCYVQNLSRVWESALHLGKRREFKKGESFSLAEDGNCFGYVAKGVTCHLLLDYIDSKDEIRFFLGPASLARDTFAAAGYGAYHSSHKCLTDVVVYQFERNLLEDPCFISRWPELVRNFTFSIAAKGVSSQLFASILKRKSNEQKIAIYLYGFYLLSKRRREFAPPFSQTYLALLLGISKLTVNRVIAQWKNEGIIGAYTKRRVEIIDVERLASLR